MKFVKTLVLISAVVVLSASGRICAARSDSREKAVGEFGYVITVPRDWTESPVDDSGSITLHLKVRPSERKGTGKTGVIGHFTVHVMDRKTTTPRDWIDYHLNYNIPSAHGACRIDDVTEVTGGSFEGTMICAHDMANHKGYGLLEALLFTEKHVLIVSYLHDPALMREAHDHMTSALQSARLSPTAAARARLDYDRGLSLGFEKFGLFVSLPRGWIPDRRSARSDKISVVLPSGSMTVHLFKRTPKGVNDLLKVLKKKEKDLSSQVTNWTSGCGVQSGNMFRVAAETEENAEALRCVMGLHEGGGYALVLRSTDNAEQDLFEKTTAGIVLMSSEDSRKKVSHAIDRFRSAIRTGDRETLSDVIPFLGLFSDNNTVTRALIAGLNSKDEQTRADCAGALGRIGSPQASKAIEKILKKRKAGEATQLACIEALSTIGGSREEEILAKFGRDRSKTCTPEVRDALDQSL